MFLNGHGDILRKPFSVKNSPEGIAYTIRGAFIKEVGRIDQDKQNMQGKRDAHYGIRFYQR